MKVIQTGNEFRICGNGIRTFEELPTRTYTVGYNQRDGCFLVERDDLEVSEKAYGAQLSKADKVLKSFENFNRNLGVILSGDKGIGKSMFAKNVCVRALKKGFPVIIVDACHEGLAGFLASIDCKCAVLFDEFDKIFTANEENDEQAELLSMFDGTDGGKKLFIVTCNNLYGLNSYLINRPGRFHYHIRFEYPTEDDIREYLTDKLKKSRYGEIEKVVEFSHKVSLNYDCLRSIAYELNCGYDFRDSIADLNIMVTEKEEYNVYLYFENGASVHHFVYRTNLYDYDGLLTCISLYNDDGEFVCDAVYDKTAAKYDVQKDCVVIPAESIKLKNLNDDDECDCASDFRGLKISYMTFSKRQKQNLHYSL